MHSAVQAPATFACLAGRANHTVSLKHTAALQLLGSRNTANVSCWQPCVLQGLQLGRMPRYGRAERPHNADPSGCRLHSLETRSLSTLQPSLLATKTPFSPIVRISLAALYRRLGACRCVSRRGAFGRHHAFPFLPITIPCRPRRPQEGSPGLVSLRERHITTTHVSTCRRTRYSR